MNKNNLNLSYNQLKSLFQNMVAGFTECEMVYNTNNDPVDYRILNANSSFLHQYGLQEDAIGKLASELFGTLDTDRLNCFGKVASSGINSAFEEYDTDSKRYFHVSVFSNKKEHFAALYDDLTDKYIQDMVNKKNAQILKIATESAGIVTWEWNVETDEHVVSQPSLYEEIFGFNPTTTNMRKMWAKRLHPDDKERTEEALIEHLAGRAESYSVEFRYKHPRNEEYVWISGQGNVVERNKDGSPKTMIGMNQNIHEKKEFEQELLRSQQRLETLSRISDVDDFDVDNLRKYALDEALLLTRSTISYSYALHEEEKTFVLNTWSDGIIDKGDDHSDTIVQDLEKLNVWKKASEMKQPIIQNHVNQSIGTDNSIVRYLSVPLISHNKVIGVVGVANKSTTYDETDKQQFDLMIDSVLKKIDHIENSKKLLEAKEEAEAATIAKSQFLATMSHEIRTPMSGVIGLAHLLNKTELNKEQKRYLKKILNSFELLQDIVDDILDFSKIETGQMDIEKIAFNLNDIVSKLRFFFRDKLKDKNLQFIVNMPKGNSTVIFGDPVRLEQVLLNLISNAIKFTDAGEITLSAAVVLKNNENIDIEFCVKDSGIGMTEQHIQKLFQPFEQGDSSSTRKYGGTGLGLAICQRLVENMGGKEIQVISEVDKGSSFIFRIPFKTSSINAFKSTSATTTPKTTKPNILLVEDSEINQEVAVAILEPEGYDVDIANNGKEAINLIKSNAYDLVLMDIQMPVLDGVEATKIIRKEYSVNKLPIIAMTANKQNADRVYYEKIGMNGTISKPVNVKELFDTIHMWTQSQSRTSLDSSPKRKNINNSIDDKAGIMKVGGNQKVYDKILQKVAKLHTDDGKRLKEMLHNKKYDEALFLSHTLKGVMGEIGAMRLYKIATNIEHNIRESLYDECLTLMPDLELELLKVISEIHERKEEKHEGQSENDPLDIEKISSLIRIIYPMVVEDDLEVKDYLDDIREIIKLTYLHHDYEKFESYIEEYDFANALIVLQEIIKKIGITGIL